MTAQLQDRPVPRPFAVNGGAPARVAVVRWAWRLFRREWRQQLLVLALIIVAVGATIVGAAVATNTPPPPHAGYGTANTLLTLPGSDAQLAADLAAIRTHFGAAEVIENQTIATGLVGGAQLRAQDPASAYGQAMLALVSGRYPTAATEVAMTRKLAATFDVQIGGTWQFGGRALAVVGLVENPQNLLDNFALVAPGQLPSPTRITVLFDSTKAQTHGFAVPSGALPVSPPGSNGMSPAVIVLAVAIVGLIFVGLVATAGFTVLAQRRLRGLGMLSALGATDRNVRLVMVANGAIVGVVGALIGAALGFAVWVPYAPHLASSAHHRVKWTHLPWWLLISCAVLAIITATLASRRPARAVARTPVVAALSGRPVNAKGVHRSPIRGAGLLVFGLLLLTFSGGWGGNGGKDTLFQLGGLLACSFGSLFIAPSATAVLAARATHAPVAVRIALRDLARYRTRSGAALAASSFAVFIAMLVALIATGRFADPVDYFGPNLPANQAVLYTPGNSPNGSDPLSTVPGAKPAAEPSLAQLQAVATQVATAVGSRDVLPLETTQAFVGQASHGGVRSGPGAVYVATPTVLTHYGIAASAIDPATLVLTSRQGLQGTHGLSLVYGDLNDPNPSANLSSIANPRIQTFDTLPRDTAAPNLLVTTYAMQHLKLQVSPGGWLITAPKSLTATQINTVREIAAGAGMTVDVKNDAPSLSNLRNYATGAGILVALGVLAMTVGLIRSESSGELRILTATGATSTTRRTITATTAGALGLLSAVLGTAVAYLVSVAFFRTQLTQRMGNTPVLDLVLVLIGLPVAATIGGWLFAGRQPSAIRHQPIE
jgi:putative ABC transport system permease protein